MDVYLAPTSELQQAGRGFVVTTVKWLKRLAKARRARLAQARRVNELRHLDPTVLEDIGIEAGDNGNAWPSLFSFNPHVTAIRIFSGSRASQNWR